MNKVNPTKEAFDQLDAFLNPRPTQADAKRRGRPPKKENTLSAKQVQNLLQDIYNRIKEEPELSNFIKITSPNEVQHEIFALESLMQKYGHLKNATKRITEIISLMISIIANSGVFEKEQDSNWEKVLLDALGLIEAYRVTMGKFCLKTLTETLVKSSLSVDIRRMTSDVINTLLTGCKENKKLLSHDYELQFRHLEILFRLCPRMQEDREIFANKVFKGDYQLTGLFLEINAEDFLMNTRNFLNVLNSSNDGVTKAPKTLKMTRMQYNRIDFDRPDQQDCFFVDFNRWTISAAVQGPDAHSNESEGSDIIDIKYQKIRNWEIVDESYSLQIGDQEGTHYTSFSSTEDSIISMTIASSEEKNIRNDIAKIFASHNVKSCSQPKVSVSVDVLRPLGSSINAVNARDTLAKSLEASQTPSIQQPTRKQAKNQKIEKEKAKDKENVFDTSSNINLSDEENRKGENLPSSLRITPPQPLQEFQFNDDSPTLQENSLSMINIGSDSDARLPFPPPKKRSKPLNLSASKKRRKTSKEETDEIGDKEAEYHELNRNTDKLDLEKASKADSQKTSIIKNLGRRTGKPVMSKGDSTDKCMREKAGIQKAQFKNAFDFDADEDVFDVPLQDVPERESNKLEKPMRPSTSNTQSLAQESSNNIEDFEGWESHAEPERQGLSKHFQYKDKISRLGSNWAKIRGDADECGHILKRVPHKGVQINYNTIEEINYSAIPSKSKEKSILSRWDQVQNPGEPQIIKQHKFVENSKDQGDRPWISWNQNNAAEISSKPLPKMLFKKNITVNELGSPMLSADEKEALNTQKQIENENSSLNTFEEKTKRRTNLNLQSQLEEDSAFEKKHGKKRVPFIERLGILVKNTYDNENEDEIGKPTEGRDNLPSTSGIYRASSKPLQMTSFDDRTPETQNQMVCESDELDGQYQIEDPDLQLENERSHLGGSEKFADDRLDQEIRGLLQCVGETIFQNYQQQDATLFQATQNAMLQEENEVIESLDRQFERRRELLDTYKRKYSSISDESQHMVGKLKEARNELEGLDWTLVEMEKTAQLVNNQPEEKVKES
ncbi:hypothetical protein G9A89_020450 [Geosiphon pyriformis]|nr:hypothetical protein G9A89_020450 [Geosiphon pyriformis]